MKNFRFIYFIFSILSFSNIAAAQETIKQQEFGITFTNLDNFGLLYRFGNSDALWQLNALSFSGLNREEGGNNINSFSMAIEFGREFREKIADPIELRFGGGLSFGYASINNTPESDRFSNFGLKQKQYRPGVYLIVGGNYKINDNVILGAELLPIISWVHSKIEWHERRIDEQDFTKYTTIEKGLRYGFNLNSIRISLAYRFIKE